MKNNLGREGGGALKVHFYISLYRGGVSGGVKHTSNVVKVLCFGCMPALLISSEKGGGGGNATSTSTLFNTFIVITIDWPAK